MINIDALNDDEKLAALESIHKSIAESKEIQKKKITTNVELIVKALKKIESDLKQRYDETGQLIANLKNGEDGRDGKDGKDGKNGRDGRDGPVGPRGYDGLPGRNGIDGTDGVSVTDAHIDFDGSLIISLSSGRVINVGEVVAADIAEKIKVITNGGGTSQGVLDAIASLQAQIDSIASGLEYQGTWNASTNVPTLASSVGTAGYYYIVATAGSTNLNGVTDWQVGDWAVFNGSVWQKIDQTNLVTSVAGRTGAVVLSNTDISGLGTMSTQAANNVSITGGSIAGITDLAIADGGTGQSTAAAAITALTGTQTSGYYLRSNGTSAALSAISAGDVPTLNQNTTGTAAGLSATLATSSGGTGLTSFTADGVPYATSTSVLATSGLLKFQATNSALTVASTTTSNGYVGFTNSADGGTQGYIGDAKALITPGINSALAVRGEDAILFGIASTEGMRLNSTGLGIGKTAGSALDVKGTLRLSGSTSGYVGLAPAAAAGSTTYTLPSADGTANQALVTNGSGTLSWASTATGTVTSVAASVPSFLSIAGSPITSSGTLAITLSGTALPTTSGGTGLTSFTANGVVYASSSSALTTGSALTFDGTTFISKSNAEFGNSLVDANRFVNVIGAGTNRDFGIQFTGSRVLWQNTGQSGLLFGVSDTERMRLTSTGLGIGTSSPALKLDVAFSSAGDGIRSYNTLSTGFADVRVGNNSNNNLGFLRVGGSAQGGIYQDSFVVGTGGGYPIKIAPQGAVTATFDVAGNLGLGVTPSAWGSALKSFENQGGAVTATSAGNFRLYQNAYQNSVGQQIYRNTLAASLYTQDGGSHIWFNAPSGTAGNAITFTQAMTLDAAGELGIGTTSPAAKLHVSGAFGSQLRLQETSGTFFDIAVGGRFDIRNNAGTTIVSIAQSGAPAGTQLNLDTSGNLGLGVTPSAWGSIFDVLQIGAGASYLGGRTDSVAGRQIWLGTNSYYDGTNWIYGVSQPAAQYYQNDGAHIWNRAASGTAGNAITFTQAMTLDASGNLAIGDTANSAAGRLYVKGSGATSGSVAMVVRNSTPDDLLYIRNDGYMTFGVSTKMTLDASGNLLVGTTSTDIWTGSATNTGFKVESNGTTTISRSGFAAVLAKRTTSDGNVMEFARGTAQVGSVSVTATATAYNTSSDQRLKENIVDAPEFGSVIDSIKVRSYDWRSDGSHQRAGFVAQELVTVAPEAVHQPEDSEEMMAVDYSKLVPMLVKEIQSLRKRLADAGI